MKIFLGLVALFTLTGCMGLEQKFANARIEMMTLIEDQAEKQRQADTKLRETIAESTARVAAGLDTVEDHMAVIQEANDERDDEIAESRRPYGSGRSYLGESSGRCSRRSSFD